MVPSVIEEQVDRLSRMQHQEQQGYGHRRELQKIRSRRHDNALFADSIDDIDELTACCDDEDDTSSVSMSFHSSVKSSRGRNPYNIYEQYRSRTNKDSERQLYLWDKLAIRGSPADTPPQELAKRATFMLICILKLGACVVWGIMFWCLNECYAALCPVTYYLAVSGAMSSLVFEGNYETFVVCQLALIFLLPFAVHLVLGGLVESGGVILWSFLAPLGAAFFRSSTESIIWFEVFVASSMTLIGYDFYEAIYLNNDNNTVEELTSMFYFTMNIIGVLSIVFAAANFFAQALEDEFGRSEALLHNTLPPSIARRIHTGENPIIDKHEEVSILFADVVGFTKATAALSPNVIIEGFLKDFFRLTDKAVENRGLTKIKTIGDAYMVVGGIEDNGPTNHAAELLRLAGDMFDIIEAVNYNIGTSFKIRIGIHQGPVIAGVLGVQRFAFDVWGDAVNTASRMESHGRPGYIHLTEEAYNATKAECDREFDFDWDGEMEVKSKGKMSTYFAKPSCANAHSSDFFSILEEEYQHKEGKGKENASPLPKRHVLKKLLKRLSPLPRAESVSSATSTSNSSGKESTKDNIDEEDDVVAALALDGPFASSRSRTRRVSGSRPPDYYRKLLLQQSTSISASSVSKSTRKSRR